MSEVSRKRGDARSSRDALRFAVRPSGGALRSRQYDRLRVRARRSCRCIGHDVNKSPRTAAIAEIGLPEDFFTQLVGPKSDRIERHGRRLGRCASHRAAQV